MRRWIPACAVVLCLFSLAHAQTNAAGDPSVLIADHPAGPIQLDGRLDEPAWRDARMVVDLVQQSPKPGAPSPYRTSVRVLVVDNKLYVGFACKDPNPAAIAVHTMQRDGNVQGDDTVAIVLDTYGDHRTGYFFRVNVAGARVDGLIAGSEEPSLDWDGIWDARTARTD